ncbi:LOW QUALITY PROTEIN: zinc finger and BTB domain-containing protein 40 [Porphyrio hochstetteri]
MELPSYSKQLLQQLYALCEQQFWDCTIFIGNVRFGAHKVVLGAASLLFRSLLDSTDTISIDASVVTPEEFALLLEMMYSGKLPLGKHNFTQVISVADSLQMFDVAVSCKNLLRDLISCSTQDQVGREVSSQAADSSGSCAEASTLPEWEKPAEGKLHLLLPQRVSPSPGPVEAEMEAGVSSPGQELAVNHTWVHQDAMQSDSRLLGEHSGSPDQPAQAKQGGSTEEELAEPLEGNRGANGLAAGTKSCKLHFFLQYESVFSEALSDAQAVLKRLEECREIDASQKEALDAQALDAQAMNAQALDAQTLDAQTLDAQTLVSLVKLFQDGNPKLREALLEGEGGSEGTLQQTGSTGEGEMLTHHLLGCREELIQSVTQLSPIVEFLEAAEEGFLTASEKQVVLDCWEGGSHREAMGNLLRKVAEEKTLRAESLVKLLGAVKASFPGLHLLLDTLVATDVSDGKVATSESSAIEIILQHSKLRAEGIQQRAALQGLAPGEAGLTEAVREMGLGDFEQFVEETEDLAEAVELGFLTEGTGEKPGIRKWKVNSESQVEALEKDEDKMGCARAKEPKETQGKASPRKSFVCKACDKTFHFYCCLKVHMKRCQVGRGKQIQCKECSEVRSTKEELEKHQLEAHGMVGLAKKKKKWLSVAYDICGEFAHASGVQYHKLTEHFDEKPFSCQECGAKFAASSRLKNHRRLHTGDRPFLCRHCLLTFMQASALAYHTKKKHAEGEPSPGELSHGLHPLLAPSTPLCPLLPSTFWLLPHPFRSPLAAGCSQISFTHMVFPAAVPHSTLPPTPSLGSPGIHPLSSLLSIKGIFLCLLLLPRVAPLCTLTSRFLTVRSQELSGLWYHNQTHHPAVFAAQSHRSSRFSSLQCSSCDKTFSSTAAHRRHVKAEHTDVKFQGCKTCKELFPTLALLQVHVKCRHSGSQPFCCLHCSASFPCPGALQSHVTTQHFKQTESTFTCELCGELFPSQGELEGHYSAEHPKVVFSQATTAQIVQVMQTSEQGAAEHIISFDEAQLAGSGVFVTLPESQAGSELVAVTMEELFDDKVTLVCEEAK